MDDRYLNIIKKLNLQNEETICELLKKKRKKNQYDIYPISSLQFEVTTHCNAFCKHCYNNSGNNSIQDRMTADRWIEFSKYIVTHGGVFECILSGGEPLLLSENLFRIMDILHQDGTVFFLITNGYLLSEDIVKRLSGYRYHSLQVSIDSTTAEYHDLFRGRKGSWERAVAGARLTAKYGIPLKVAHCVTPYNIDGIDDMCQLAYTIGAKSIMVGEVCLSGRTAVNRDLLLNDDERKMLYEKIKKNQIMYEGKMKIKTSHSVREGLKKQSQWPDSGVTIRPNGDIRIDGMAPFVIGNVLDDDFSEVWRQKIHNCWDDLRVMRFIESFKDDDRNYAYINYVDSDIYI